MANESMLQDAINAIQQEKFDRARDILTRLIRQDQQNPTYWLWMSAAVQNRREKIYCLQTVLKDDPQNELAKQGLVLLGALPVPKDVLIKPSERRKWTADLKLPPTLITNANRRRSSSLILSVILGIFVFSIILFVGFRLTATQPVQRIVIQKTKTPGPPPTYTPTPTYIGYIAQPTTSEADLENKPTPLWMLLPATYTPTPIYINTPHPISEAYRAGMLAYEQSNWTSAIGFFEQAFKVEGNAADIAYYLAESQRLAGNLPDAWAMFQNAVQINPGFAPAYLGLARVQIAQGKMDAGLADLNKAIQLDPNFAEAYVERVNTYLSQNQLNEAEDDLQKLTSLLPESPLPYLLKAKLSMRKSEFEVAEDAAQQAYELDQTILETYLIYGKAALLNHDYEVSREKLRVYLQYNKKDGSAWYLYGRSLAEFGNEKDLEQAWLSGMIHPQAVAKALDAFEKAEMYKLNEADFSLYRSGIYLELQEGQKAVNDLLSVRALVLQYKTSGASNIWFAYNVALARAFFYAGRNSDAILQFNQAEILAAEAEQKALVYGWRGLVYEKDGKQSLANRDWIALTNLPRNLIPQSLQSVINQKLLLLTPSPTNNRMTATTTPTP